jgi:hypothetical protein
MHVVSIAGARSGIGLSFYHGATLPDPPGGGGVDLSRHRAGEDAVAEKQKPRR